MYVDGLQSRVRRFDSDLGLHCEQRLRRLRAPFSLAASGYRCIATASDLADGETLARTLPPALLVTLACTEARARRDAQLRSCDWTQVVDAPLSDAQRAGWVSYRRALRFIPDQPGFPAEIQWPEVPDSAAT